MGVQRGLLLRKDGVPHPDGWIAGLSSAVLRIRDNTGVVLATPTDFTDLKGAPMAVLHESEDFDANLTDGTITAKTACLALVFFNAALVTAVNNQVLEIRTLLGAAVTGVEAGYAKVTQAATGVIDSIGARMAVVQLKAGDVLKTQAKASTGNATVKDYVFGVVKIADLDPPAAAPRDA